jgi:O-antigen biosynthesis protein WbqP
MIRLFDLIISVFGLLFLSPLFVLLLIIGILDTGSPLFHQKRMGIGQKPFQLFKFRTMRVNTEGVATHLVQTNAITKWGSIMRKFKLDELPQLINVFRGEMSLVGPRPNLFNQFELINERSKRGVYSVRPGITGLAQINKIDMSTPGRLAETDAEMIKCFSLLYYFKYISLTVFGKGFGDRVKQVG